MPVTSREIRTPRGSRPRRPLSEISWPGKFFVAIYRAFVTIIGWRNGGTMARIGFFIFLVLATAATVGTLNAYSRLTGEDSQFIISAKPTQPPSKGPATLIQSSSLTREGLEVTSQEKPIVVTNASYEPLFGSTPAARFAAAGQTYYLRGLSATEMEVSDEYQHIVSVPVGSDVYMNGKKLGTVVASAYPDRVKFAFAKPTDLLFLNGDAPQPIGLTLATRYVVVDFALVDPTNKKMSVNYQGKDGSPTLEYFTAGDALQFPLANGGSGPDSGFDDPFYRITLPPS